MTGRCANPSCGKTIERNLIQGSRTHFRNMGDRDDRVETERFSVCSWRCLRDVSAALDETERQHEDEEPM